MYSFIYTLTQHELPFSIIKSQASLSCASSHMFPSPALRTTNGLRLLGSIISVLGLHRLHQLDILFLRLIGGKTLVDNSLPRSLLRLALLPQTISAHVLFQTYIPD